MLLLAATIIALQAPPATGAPSTGDVTVTAERPAERRARASAYVRRVGVANGETPVARWLDPFCPKIVGLDPALSQRVERRVRAVAADAGAPLGKSRCKHNATIAFVADGEASVRRVALRNPVALAEVPLPTRAAVTGPDVPIRWWYATQVRTREGKTALSDQPPMVQIIGDSAATLPVGPDGQFHTPSGSGFVSTEFVRALYAATVVIDVNAMTGVPLDTVADFAGFVAVAEVRAGGTAPADSILALPTDRATRGLSDWDRTLLTALYRMPLDRLARTQRQALTARLLDGAAGP